MDKKLYKSNKDQVIDGVCGGIGEYFNVDPVIIRILAVILLFVGFGFIGYIACMIIIPRRPKGLEKEAYTVYSEEGKEVYKKFDANNTKQVLGVGLIIIGGFLLAKRHIPFINSEYIFPIILIIVGLVILFGKDKV